MKKKIGIHWFRNDLRTIDNPSLNHLSRNYDNVLGVYIFDEVNIDPKLGSASKVWLNHSLKYLKKQLNGNLIILKGNPEDCLDESKKAQKYEGNTVFFNSFQILGQVASQGFIGNPDVQRSMKKVYELMDYEKLNYLGN